MESSLIFSARLAQDTAKLLLVLSVRKSSLGTKGDNRPFDGQLSRLLVTVCLFGFQIGTRLA
jgi:hypothetical protein